MHTEGKQKKPTTISYTYIIVIGCKGRSLQTMWAGFWENMFDMHRQSKNKHDLAEYPDGTETRKLQ